MYPDNHDSSVHQDIGVTLKSASHDLSSRITQAVACLNHGELVAFPTETVYGLGAEISQAAAIEKLFSVKGRPKHHPLIVHFAHLADLDYWAENIPDYAWQLAEHFWPGPLTLILKKSVHVPSSVTGGQDTVGLRIPNHPLALALLTALGPHKALAAPSANRFGHISPTLASHVETDFGNTLGMILDGGACTVGVESTIIACISHPPVLLRPGGISPVAIEQAIKCSLSTKAAQASIRVSGSLASHYAPVTPLKIMDDESTINYLDILLQQGLRIGVLVHSPKLQALFARRKNVRCIAMPDNPQDYARRLYATLRALDRQNLDHLIVEDVPEETEWLAIADRLQRASYHGSSNS